MLAITTGGRGAGNMKKKLIINTCSECPYYDNEYYDFNQLCTRLERVIDPDLGIPEDCPLETTDEDLT